VGILCHSASLISVKEHVVNIEGSSNEGLVVGNCGRNRATNGVLAFRTSIGIGIAVKSSNGPETFIDRTDIKVNLDLVVLESNKREGKTRVGAEPKLEGHVESCFRESVTRSANLTGSKGVARTIDIGERRISDESKLSSVTNHLEITALLFGGHSELIPDVHPIAILTIDSLTTNFNLNLSDELLAREI
jgi:hypothetical protein